MKMIFVLTLEKATCHIDNYRLQAAIMSRYFCLKIVAMSTKVLGARSLKRQHLKLLCVEHSNGCTVGIYGIVRMKLKNLQMSLIHILLTHPRQFYHLHDSFEKKLCVHWRRLNFYYDDKKASREWIPWFLPGSISEILPWRCCSFGNLVEGHVFYENE